MAKFKTNKAENIGGTKRVMPAAVSGKGSIKVASGTSASKLLSVIAMLRRPDGVTIAELAEVTGWKPNSIRGAISGSVRKRRLMKVTVEVSRGVRTYRVTG